MKFVPKKLGTQMKTGQPFQKKRHITIVNTENKLMTNKQSIIGHAELKTEINKLSMIVHTGL